MAEAQFHASRVDARSTNYQAAETRARAAEDLQAILANGSPRRDSQGRPLPQRAEVGGTGEHVRALQHAINAYYGRRVVEVDGDFRRFTRDALRGIQRELNPRVAPDAVAGKDTYGRLGAALAGTPRRSPELPAGVRVEPTRPRSAAAEQALLARGALAPPRRDAAPAVLAPPRRSAEPVPPAVSGEAARLAAVRDSTAALAGASVEERERALGRIAALSPADRELAARQIATVPAERRVDTAAALVRGGPLTAEVRAATLAAMRLDPGEASRALHGVPAGELDPRVRGAIGLTASDAALAALRAPAGRDRSTALQTALGQLDGLPTEVRAAEVRRVADSVLAGDANARVDDTASLLAGGDIAAGVRADIIADLRRERGGDAPPALADDEAWRAAEVHPRQPTFGSPDPVRDALGTTAKPASLVAGEAALQRISAGVGGLGDPTRRSSATRAIGEGAAELARLRQSAPADYDRLTERLLTSIPETRLGETLARMASRHDAREVAGDLTTRAWASLAPTDRDLVARVYGGVHGAADTPAVVRAHQNELEARRVAGVVESQERRVADDAARDRKVAVVATVAATALVPELGLARLMAGTRVGQWALAGIQNVGTRVRGLFTARPAAAVGESGWVRGAIQRGVAAERVEAAGVAPALVARRDALLASVRTQERAIAEAERALIAARTARLQSVSARLDAARPAMTAAPRGNWSIGELIAGTRNVQLRSVPPPLPQSRIGVWTAPGRGTRDFDMPRIIRRLGDM